MMKRRLLVCTALVAALAAMSAALPAFAGTVVKINVDPAVEKGPVKRMNAVNNGPTHNKRGDQVRDNFLPYKAARIPYARLHDSALWFKHTVDITQVFPDFSADENNPASYDFTLTDQYLQNIIDAGTKPFYRLGQSIENASKKYDIYPPADYAKWARICEHIIRHYNEGWADGYRWNLEYWEIWNEPDYQPNCWGGTMEQFHDLFATAAKHLKKRFPNLKIGGPAFCRDNGLVEVFVCEMARRKVPMDFLSWHRYTRQPEKYSSRAVKFRGILDKYGYTATECILDEWNYVQDWVDNFPYSSETMADEKGAALVGAVMAECQNSPVDMAMYYDARLTTCFNGLFNFRTYCPLKPYWSVFAWSELSDLGTTVAATEDDPEIYAVAAKDASGRLGVYLARYTNDNNVTSAKTVQVDFAGVDLSGRRIRVQTVDSHYDFGNFPYELKDGAIELKVQPSAVIYLAIE